MKSFISHIFAVLLIIALLATLGGCGQRGGNTEAPSEQKVPAQTETKEPEQPEPTVPGTPEPTPPDEAPTTEVDPMEQLDALRQQLTAEGKHFAVAYLGFMPSDCDTVWDYTDSLSEGVLRDVPFLNQIPETNMIGSASFGEVYCIVLADPDTSMKIYTGTPDTAFDNLLYEGSGEDPFLLICNADFSPDTELVFTESKGESIVWKPKLDDYMYVEQPRYANGSTPSLDFSPYNALLLSYYEEMRDSGDWKVPTKAELENTTWYWDGYTTEGNYYEYRVSFHEVSADVRWNAGYGETTSYRGASWTFEEGELPVLNIDFAEFAGICKYNLLVDWDMGIMYIAADASGKTLTWDSQAQYRFLLLDQSSASPLDLIGTWERTQTEVDGDVVETPAGQVILQITGSNEADLRAAYRDAEFPDDNYSDKALYILTDGDTMGFGHVEWIAQLDHTGRFGQEFALAIVDDALVIRSYFTVDGAPGVSYATFRKVN